MSSAEDDLLAELREAAADRPAHLAYFEDLVTWHRGGRVGEEPDHNERSGVSFVVGVDLAGDVERIFTRSGKLAYPERRRRYKQGAIRGRRTKDSLEYLLPQVGGTS